MLPALVTRVYLWLLFFYSSKLLSLLVTSFRSDSSPVVEQASLVRWYCYPRTISLLASKCASGRCLAETPIEAACFPQHKATKLRLKYCNKSLLSLCPQFGISDQHLGKRSILHTLIDPPPCFTVLTVYCGLKAVFTGQRTCWVPQSG